MAGNEGQNKPRPPPRPPGQGGTTKGPTTAPPARRVPTGTGASSFELKPVTGQSFSELTGRTQPELARGSSPDLPRVPSSTATTARELEPVGAPPRKADPALRRQILASGFDDDERTQVDTRLGGSTGPVHLGDVAEAESALTDHSTIIDGETPVAGVTALEDWKAVNAPVQSRPGRRSAKTTWLVIDQFACGANPRYRPEPGRPPRAHIFVWDVSRAMGCEVPHFLGGRVMPLGHTVDWLRAEGPVRGWRRTTDLSAVERASRDGLMIIAMPRDARNKLMAVVRPGGLDGGVARVACAGLIPGNDMTVRDAFGGPAAEYFIHE